MNQSILNKAAQQVLCEVLGYDEGKLYYAILAKQDSRSNISYSKRYRILKSLYIQGALAKIKNQKRDYYIYEPLPPSFLHSKGVEKEIVICLEQLYMENFSDLLETSFSQVIMRDDTGLVFFLLNYIMKENANVSGSNFHEFIPKRSRRNVSLKESPREDKRLGVIDRRFAFEFSVIRQKDAYDCVGFIATKENYIADVERNLEVIV